MNLFRAHVNILDILIYAFYLALRGEIEFKYAILFLRYVCQYSRHSRERNNKPIHEAEGNEEIQDS